MSNVTNAGLADRTGQALVSVAVAAIAGLMVIATFGHPPTRAEAQAAAVPSLVSPAGDGPTSTSAFTDPSLPSAASVIEQAVDAGPETAATF
jgi:hypothetical protein